MITVTDLFCGAGGSSLGAAATGQVEISIAANHWATAIDGLVPQCAAEALRQLIGRMT